MSGAVGFELAAAIAAGDTEALRSLLDAGASPDANLADVFPARKAMSLPLLLLAVEERRSDCVRLLIDAGARVHWHGPQVSGLHGYSNLMQLAVEQRWDSGEAAAETARIIGLLHAAGCSSDDKYPTGKGPLTVAVRNGAPAVILDALLDALGQRGGVSTRHAERVAAAFLDVYALRTLRARGGNDDLPHLGLLLELAAAGPAAVLGAGATDGYGVRLAGADLQVKGDESARFAELCGYLRGLMPDGMLDREGTALRTAAARGRLGIMMHLVDHGNCAPLRGQRLASALAAASAGACLPAVKTLIDAGARADPDGTSGDTVLHRMAGARPGWSLAPEHLPQILEAAALMLIDIGAGVNARNAAGRTPLHEAAAGGRGQMVGILLALGADPDPVDTAGVTPLWLAVTKNNATHAGALIAAGANAALVHNGSTLLHAAAAQEPGFTGGAEYEIACALLNNGVQVDAADSQGMTPLGFAARGLKPDLVALFLAAGADPDAVPPDAPCGPDAAAAPDEEQLEAVAEIRAMLGAARARKALAQTAFGSGL